MTQTPTREQILAWLADHPDAGAKRDIARAFGLKGAEKIELKRLLRQMAEEGVIERRRRSFHDSTRLPPVTVLQVLAPDAAGDLWARPLEWGGEGEAPRCLVLPSKGEPALGAGDRILGPAVIQEVTTTIVIEPGWTAELDPTGVYVLTLAEAEPALAETAVALTEDA